MISVKAKLEDLGVDVDQFSAGMVESFQMAIAEIAMGAQNEWIRLAQTRLHSTRETYIQGLRQSESFTTSKVGPSSIFEIQLVGKMPNAFEFGMSPFDMKQVRPGWLGGAKAHTAKDGHKYTIIPFRHSTSSSTNYTYTGKAKVAGLKQQLRKTVREYGLDRMVKTATGQVVNGPVKKVPNDAKVHQYLKGLTRVQKSYAKPSSGSSKLMTFRVMSENSPEGSWRHPGVPGAKILPEIERWVDQELDKVIEMMLGV